MNEQAKILLSKKELTLLQETEFFFSKRIITEKIFHQLNEVRQCLLDSPSFKKISFPAGTDTMTGKISKGENYLGLPFIILDFPKLFTAQETLAFRTMIWWGHFASCTLLLSGTDSKRAHEKLLDQLSLFKKKNVFLCIHASPWHHHFEKENYRPLKRMDKNEVKEILSGNSFLKVARKIPLSQINKVLSFSAESFELFARLL